MSSGKDFVETLKRIRYPEADKTEASEFDWMFSDEELKPFLKCFCSLTEDNVLTTEEVETYTSIVKSEIDTLALFKVPEDDFISVEEKRNEIEFMKKHLALIEGNNKEYEHQRDALKKHELNLFDEKDAHEEMYKNIKLRLKSFEDKELPKAHLQLSSSLKVLSNIVCETESLVTDADGLPPHNLFKTNTEPYLEAEGKLLEHVKFYLQSNFEWLKQQQRKREDSVEGIPLNLDLEQLKEIAFLNKVMKIAKLKKIEVMAEITRLEEIKKLQGKLENKKLLEQYDLPAPQLKIKLDEAESNLKICKQQEKLLLSDAHDAISKHVDAQCEQIAVVATEEKIKRYEYYLQKMNLSQDVLLSQRARLELLFSYLSLQDERLHSIKNLIQQIADEMKKEEDGFNERKAFYETKTMEETSEESQYLAENSLPLSLYKILCVNDETENQDMSKIAIEDVLEKAEKLHETKVSVEQKHQQMQQSWLKSIKTMDKEIILQSKLLLYKDDKHTQWADKEHKLNVEANKVAIKHAALEDKIQEQEQDFKEKQKRIERDSNLALSRDLFVYALTDEERFEKSIEDIKTAIQHSPFYNP